MKQRSTKEDKVCKGRTDAEEEGGRKHGRVLKHISENHGFVAAGLTALTTTINSGFTMLGNLLNQANAVQHRPAVVMTVLTNELPSASKLQPVSNAIHINEYFQPFLLHAVYSFNQNCLTMKAFTHNA